ADHPDVVADKRFRSANQWPANLPGFRDNVMAYCDAREGLLKKLVRLSAAALALPPVWFDAAFEELQYKLRMTHYPPQETAAADDLGIATPHHTRVLPWLEPNA